MKKFIIIISILFLISPIFNAEIINQYFNDYSITINPTNPTGENGWYITPVEVIYHAHDPPLGSSGLYCIKYRIIITGIEEESDWLTHYIDYYCTDYNFSVLLSIDGIFTVEFFAIDGYLAEKPLNEGPIHSSNQIKVDMTPPNSDIITPLNGFLYFNGNKIIETFSENTIIIGGITIEVNADDITSGVSFVQFNIEEFESDDTSIPYSYDFHKFYFIPNSCQVTISCKDYAGNNADDISMNFIKWL
jgi:hypothetical protein